MASVIDSIRTTVGAKHAVMKIIILSGALAYPAYRIAFVSFDGWLTLWPILTFLFLFYVTGFIITIVNNEINDNTVLVPGLFNPLKYITAGIGAIISVLPISALIGFAYYGLSELGTAKAIPMPYTITVISLVEILLYTVLIAQILLFAEKFNPFNAFNFVSISKIVSDILLQTIKLLFVLCLFSAICILPIGVIVLKIFDIYSFGFLYYLSFVIILYLMIMLYFYGQIFMENMVAKIEVNYDEHVDNSGFTDENQI